MFNECKSLEYLIISNFNFEKIESIDSNIFDKCNSLEKKNLITQNKKVLDAFDNRIVGEEEVGCREWGGEE